jgi:hypothetical protein
MTLEEVGGYKSVQHWLEAHGRHWNRSAEEAERKQKLDVLQRYCEFTGRDPDFLISNLFRETPEGPRIRLKRRREEIAKIGEFEATAGEGDPRRGRNDANVVRSFFIHNGVALTATPFR